MKLFYKVIFSLLLSCFCFSANAKYVVKGQLNLGEDWQPKLFMAAVKKLNDYYRTTPDLITNVVEVDENGFFELEGDNLPQEARFYRLYLMKKQNSDYDACLYVGGDDHNFIHIILNNDSQIEIITDPASVAPFGNYTIKGSQENKLMRALAKIVYPSFYFYRIKFPTELKFSEQKLHTNLKSFVDTCSNTMVALAAINNTDIDEYFEMDEEFYRNFGERLNTELPKSVYTQNYQRKLQYYAQEQPALPNWVYASLAALGLFIIALLAWISRLSKKLSIQNELLAKQAATASTEDLSSKLTRKEKEIFDLISSGKSNKEIASALFVELSTVKTHINRIYAKIEVNNRKEAMEFHKKITNSRV